MTIKEWIMITSAIIVVLGWFINSYFNRKHERLKKQIEYRLMTLQSFFPVVVSLTSSANPFKDDKQLVSKIEEARINFQLYGYQDEIDLYNNFIEALEKQDNNNPRGKAHLLNASLVLLQNLTISHHKRGILTE
ncbi:MAG: hypothetical protein U9R39_06675 [Campylobacterota bacterium]|nr:hypothetical protein [Campylobacterota bacterium]